MKKYMEKMVLWSLLVRTVKEGVHFQTPIFQGAEFEADIQPLLQESWIVTEAEHIELEMVELVNILISQ